MSELEMSTSDPEQGVRSKARSQQLSFASVAALAASQPTSKGNLSSRDIAPHLSSSESIKQQSRVALLDEQTESLRDSVARLSILNASGPIIASTDSDEQTPVSESIRFDDEKTHLSSMSNPTISTDVRSVVSGTTFALDEKESIRPDESASVKAVDEEDSNSGATSGGQPSRAGSEAGKAFRDQFHEITGAKRALPLTANLVQRMPDETGMTASSAATLAYVCPPPDEKLLEALQSQRDRMFLLQMEQQIITFVKSSKEQSLNLPPGNAFCRLLAHRLADYYSLTHTAEPGGSVRVSKTDISRLPQPLSEIATLQSSSVGHIIPQPTRKIMRRSEKVNASTVLKFSSSPTDLGRPSPKASSDTSNASPEDLGTSKDSPPKDTKRPTLEEREAKYNARREELYKDIPEKISADNSNAASRASSTLGGQRTKKRFPKNDDFEPRSVYTNMSYPNGPQQNVSYSQRAGHNTYPFHPSSQSTSADALTQTYGQAGNAQQSHPIDASKDFGNVYAMNNMSGYYDTSYHSYDMAQGNQVRMSHHPGQQTQISQSSSTSSFDRSQNGMQQMQPYFIPQYDSNFGYGTSRLLSQTHNQIGQTNQYGLQPHLAPFTGQMGHMVYPAIPSGMLPVYTPGHEAGFPYNRAASSIHGGVASHPGTTMQSSSGAQSQVGGYQSAMVGIGHTVMTGHTNSGYPKQPSSHPPSWSGSNRSQPRDVSRTDDFVVPRQEYSEPNDHIGSTTKLNYGQGQLNKYDTSSLPPKPPAPAASNH